MGFLRNLFGPSQEEVWQQLAAEISAKFVDSGLWHGDKFQAQIKQWTVTIDTFTVSTPFSESSLYEQEFVCLTSRVELGEASTSPSRNAGSILQERVMTTQPFVREVRFSNERINR